LILVSRTSSGIVVLSILINISMQPVVTTVVGKPGIPP
jgi:hypothetical protein